MRTVILNGKMITPYRVLEGCALVLQDRKIKQLSRDCSVLSGDEVIDAEGCYVSPGFIDIHSHGGGGHDFMDGTVEAVIGAAKAHLAHGTTSLVPTTLTSTDQDLFNAFTCFAAAKKEMEKGPNLLGLHLEGPYFSQVQRGAQDSEYIREPVPEHYLKILDASPDILRVSLAPELPGAMKMANILRERGILAAIGHSDALYEDMLEAVEHGFALVTHLYSGMSTIRRIHAYRQLGVVESAYLLDDLYVEIIADGKHLPPELLKLILKQKPVDKICLITDSMRGAGMPEGSRPRLGSLENGQETVIENGVAMLPDRSAFAGSVCTADRCVRTMVQQVQIPVEAAVRMITVNPAKVLGIASHKGKLCTGMDADICIFDEDIRIKKVFVGGELCHSA